MRASYKLAGPIALGLVLLDQATKLWIQNHMVLYTTRPVIPDFFNIVYVLNRGAAFGFLNRSDIAWQTYFFFAATALAVMIIVHLLRMARDDDKLLVMGLGSILGGAIGNLIDRIKTGQVVDFLDFYWKSYHWPAFNVADIAIFLGSLALLVAFYRMRRPASGR
ncbi:lipoprotein signal peptidase [Solidesulfovibrio carbinoliphilus subsp. oakridgensis]|uniref:Lipoprotein signal peptidase n=1 Tax=Solidesulfovibrio carbinoliphilus subsp. oakridgensis TaxID=694327 RepID=G7QDZ0_9BACT|nr:signal peptidase II [Solidesulfovibrio carbinoliphilus]EHJ46646.1 lipoprotein signal peptidase [Solidesulfovibrio carbinoliphilus subsp. oakridgensis]